MRGTEFLFGNPHFVCFREKLDLEELEYYGRKIETYKIFPDNTNVEFVKILDKNRIQVIVWERGVGRTLSCGTGACASSLASIIYQSTNSELIVELEGGKLRTSYDKDTEEISLNGNCEFVYQGKINL